MSIDLRKDAATDSLVNLLKREAAKGNELGELSAQVIVAIDFSLSMDGRYRNKEVQDLVERALGLSLPLDDDGTVQVFFFHDSPLKHIEVDANNYQGVVGDFYSQNRMGGTNYSKTIDKIVEFVSKPQGGVFRKKEAMIGPGKPPVFVLFVTDGDPNYSDKAVTQAKLIEYAGLPIFWQFLGLGHSPAFLSELDTMGGRVVDNVNLFDVNDSRSLPDPEFYDRVIDEWASSWLPKARQAGVLS